MRLLSTQFVLSLVVLAGLFSTAFLTHAQTVEELQKKIADQTSAIQKLEKEILQYQGDLNTLATKKKTLSNAIATLEITRKKLETDIKLTQKKVDTTDLKIRQIGSEISYKEDEISGRIAALREALLAIYESDEQSLAEIALSNDSFSGLWNDLETLEQFSDGVSKNVDLIKVLKQELENKNKKQKAEKGKLLGLKDELGDQKKITEDNKKQTATLLAQTKNKESEYQKLLSAKQASKDQFEKELYDLESQLKFILDPNSIPAKGSKVLLWPLDVIRITQYFGNTEFSKTGAYSGHGHNGVDFGVGGGTKVYAALSGRVLAVNTKVASMCQYGKWVLIQHDNGLSTLYAHLSLVSVNSGDVIKKGKITGYSGDTGYSFGEHLHFTVYASKAVTFKEYTCNSGAKLTIPVSAFSGYLNPMDYM